MKKNNIALTLCLLCATYSCDGCMDDAEIVEKAKHDSRENYNINRDPYAKDRKKIANYWHAIFQPEQQKAEDDILKPIEKILPNVSAINTKSTTTDFFYVNNNIALKPFLNCCLQEKIWIELLIETMFKDDTEKKNKLLSSFKKYLKEGEKKIRNILNNLDKNQNQDIYSKMGDLNEKFNDEVLEKIFSEIIQEGKDLPNIEKYKNQKTYTAVAHVLLCDMMSEEERGQKFAEKYNKYNKEEK